MARILLVDDEQSFLSVLNTLLTLEGHEVVPILDGHAAVEAIRSREFDLMISDIRMTPLDGMELMRIAHEERPSMAIIMLTAFGSVDTAVQALRMGAYDYVTKPFRIDELLMAVQKALDYRKAISENADLLSQVGSLKTFDSIVAESAAMKHVCQLIEHVGPADTAVLIRGEPGNGKALVARTLHNRSPRKTGPFVDLDCATFAGNALNQELFGSSNAAKAGAIESAGGGTLYLRNIETLPLAVQERLFRTLQDREFVRSDVPSKVQLNARVIASTSASLDKMIRDGKFREDLSAKISVISLDIPPLRERREDILPLVYAALLHEVGGDTPLPALEPSVREAFMAYPWPGNVEELFACVRHALSLCSGGVIKKTDLPSSIASSSPSGTHALAHDPNRGKSLRTFLRSKEKEYVEHMLQQTKGDKDLAAKALKISRAALSKKLPTEDQSQ